MDLGWLDGLVREGGIAEKSAHILHFCKEGLDRIQCTKISIEALHLELYKKIYWLGSRILFRLMEEAYTSPLGFGFVFFSLNNQSL